MQKTQVQQIAEEMQKQIGKDAQKNNFLAAQMVAETVKSTLGPKGMDKMIVDSLGDVLVTNDGVTILQEMQIEHPAAKMMVEIAKTQEEEVGDGTTTAVVLAGELIKRASGLLMEGVHPTTIVRGYGEALQKSNELINSLTVEGFRVDTETLIKVAKTAMTGKGAETAKDLLAELCVAAVDIVSEKFTKDMTMEDVRIETKVGGKITDSRLVRGIVLDNKRIHQAMPEHVSDAKIMLLNQAMEVKDSSIDMKIQIVDPNKIKEFNDQEELLLKGLCDKVIATGAQVVICQKGIDEVVQYYLAKNKIYAVRLVDPKALRNIAKATGATIVNNLGDATKEDLGWAKDVGENEEQGLTYIEGCKDPKAITLLVHGGTSHVVAEVERAMRDALGDILATFRSTGGVVAGAGAFEMELVARLKDHVDKLPGREQLAYKAFCESLEIIPKTLAENAGLDKIDMVTELRAAHAEGKKNAGIDVYKGKIIDAVKAGVIEPLKIKSQAINSATEVVEMLLRIDDVIAGKDLESRQ